MRKKKLLLYMICMFVLFCAVGCKAKADEQSSQVAGFIKKDAAIGVYVADDAKGSYLIADAIIKKAQENKLELQNYKTISDIEKEAISTLFVCAQDHVAATKQLQGKTKKAKVVFVGDVSAIEGISISATAYGHMAADAIYADMQERGQSPGIAVAVGKAGEQLQMQEAFLGQAQTYGWSVQPELFEAGEAFFGWLKAQAGQQAIGIFVVDADAAVAVAQFSIENGLTDKVSIITLGAEEGIYTHLRLCSISGVLLDNPDLLAEAALAMVSASAKQPTTEIVPLLLTRKNIDDPTYRIYQEAE